MVLTRTLVTAEDRKFFRRNDQKFRGFRMSTLISANESPKGSHDENDRRTPLSHQPPPTKPPLSSSFNSAALAAHRQHSPLERRSSSVLANRTARSNSQLIRTPIETYLPSLQVVYGQSVAGSDEASRGVMSEAGFELLINLVFYLFRRSKCWPLLFTKSWSA